MINIFGRKTAFNVQKVLWFLEELNLDFKLIELGGDFGGLDTSKFLKMNINGTIPVLDDNGNYIWESHTILRYLAAKYGCKDWHYDNPIKRSEYERWMDWGQTRFQPIFMKLFWGYYRTPSKDHDMKIIKNNIQECNTCLEILSKVLEKNEYLIGDKISLADICVGSILYRLLNIGLDINLPKKVSLWFKKLLARKGYKNWIMSDFSSLKNKISY